MKPLTHAETPRNSPLDLGAICRQCRLDIAEAFARHPELGFQAIASASLKLAPLVEEGTLSKTAAFEPLREAAVNLGLVRMFGQESVEAAICSGPIFLRSLAVRAAA